MHIERVDPASVAEEASLVLREAFPAPALHYTADYLRWQLGFPGARARAALAREGDEPAGFVGLTPRRFKWRGVETDGHVLSFVAVRPQFRGRGLAGELYAEILRDVRDAGLPTVVFVEAHSPAAQHVLFKAVERAGVRMKRLGQHENHGFVLRAGAAPLAASATPVLDPAPVLDAIAACSAERVLWAAPDRAQLEHHLRDPRPRKLLVVEEQGRTVGAASVLLAEITAGQGLERVPTVDAVFLPEPTSDRVAAVMRATAELFAAQATSPVVSAPSLTIVPPEQRKAAGLRRTGAIYESFVLLGDEHPCLAAEVTNLEVV